MITRRNFIYLTGSLLPACFLADALMIEPSLISVVHLKLGESPTHRIVHFSDLHHKGNQSILKKVVLKINQLSPDFVCFTGDLVENESFLEETLDLLSSIEKPMYGVPGNHDYWSGVPFEPIASCFEATGGAWLVDRDVPLKDRSVQILGKSGRRIEPGQTGMRFSTQAGETVSFPVPGDLKRQASSAVNPQLTRSVLNTGADVPLKPLPTPKRILLTHYPADVKTLGGESYDLILAGHSHGGQVRLPFLGAPLVPSRVEGYVKGLYSTPAGPLYVNVGIGTWLLPVRFLCRPEITVLEL